MYAAGSWLQPSCNPFRDLVGSDSSVGWNGIVSLCFLRRNLPKGRGRVQPRLEGILDIA